MTDSLNSKEHLGSNDKRRCHESEKDCLDHEYKYKQGHTGSLILDIQTRVENEVKKSKTMDEICGIKNCNSVRELVKKGWSIYNIFMKNGTHIYVVAKEIRYEGPIPVYKVKEENGIFSYENLGMILFGRENNANGIFGFLTSFHSNVFQGTIRTFKEITDEIIFSKKSIYCSIFK